MAKTSLMKKAKFICEPQNVNVETEFNLNRSVTVSLLLDNVLAVKLDFKTDIFPKKENDYYEIINNFFNSYTSLEESDLYNISTSYMPALNIHRNIKKVLTRSGKMIWNRPRP